MREFIKKKQRVLLDADGVVVNFIAGAEAVALAVTGAPLPVDATDEWDLFRSYDAETQTKLYDMCKTMGWCLALEPYPGAVDFMRKLEEIADVYFVTSPMGGPHWAYEREQWLNKHFGLHHHKVVSTNAKYICGGNVFVDDKFSHVAKWQEEHRHGTAVLWDQPYNRNHFWDNRAQSYDDILAFV